MNNWRNERDYDQYKGLTWRQFAWEFLRRNPRYQRDWKRLSEALADYKPKSLQYAAAQDVKSGHLALKWELVLLIDPALDYKKASPQWRLASVVELNESNMSPYLECINLGLKTSVPLPDKSLVAMGFDVRKPIKPQLETAKKILERYHHQHKKFEEAFAQGLRQQKRLMPTYLRILDASASGATNAVWGKIICGTKAGREAIMIKANQQIKAAKNLVQNYKSLLVLND